MNLEIFYIPILMKLFLWLFFMGLAMGLSPYIVFGLAEDATEE
jgi:hypothetical protein